MAELLQTVLLEEIGLGRAPKIDVLHHDEDALGARPPVLVDEVGNLVGERIHLNDDGDLEALLLAQADDAIEYLPSPCCGRNCRR